MVKRLLLSAFFILSFVGASYAQNYIDMCLKYLEADDYQKAIEMGEKALKLYSNDSYAYLAYVCLGVSYTGITFKGIEQTDLAVENLKKAISLKKLQMYANGRNDKELNYLYSLLLINYSHYEELGDYYKKIGNKKLAKEYYNKAYSGLKSMGLENEANKVLSLISELK